MGLCDIYEVLAIGRKVDRVIEGRIGQPLIAFTVQSDAVQLQLHMVVTAACQVIQHARFFIHARQSWSATHAPVIDAVRVPPSA